MALQNLITGGGNRSNPLGTGISALFRELKYRMTNFRTAENRALKYKNKGFTLAEVLITLGIIGVVAALTIPTLMQKTNDKELVSGTLKAATVLSNALREMEAITLNRVDKMTGPEFMSNFVQHLKTVPCEDNKVCLADGSTLSFGTVFSFAEGCTKNWSDSGYARGLENSCVDILVDVNGDKGPNMGGKDRYLFYVTKNGIVAEGAQDTCSGSDCTAYVLFNRKLWEGEFHDREYSGPEDVDLTGQTCNAGSTAPGYKCDCGRSGTCKWIKE